MKKSIIMAAALLVATASCRTDSGEGQGAPSAQDLTISDDPMVLTDCDIVFDGVRFNKAVNGGDSLVEIKDSVLEFDCSEGRDLFNDPNMKLSNHSVPAIMTEIDNTKPFTFSAKVNPGFSADGTYNAAELLVFANNTLYQKLCFEQDERGNHRVVSVRTEGTSDDSNHDIVTDESVYLKISSDTRTIASYYSTDGLEWRMVRLYRNNYPSNLLVGIASQAPKSGNCLSQFSDLKLEKNNVSDFRMGE